jgi:hypothetical protein
LSETVVGIKRCSINVENIAIYFFMPYHGITVNLRVPLVTGVGGYLEFCPGGDLIAIDIIISISIIIPDHQVIKDPRTVLIAGISTDGEFCPCCYVVSIDVPDAIPVINPCHNVTMDCGKALLVWT